MTHEPNQNFYPCSQEGCQQEAVFERPQPFCLIHWDEWWDKNKDKINSLFQGRNNEK